MTKRLALIAKATAAKRRKDLTSKASRGNSASTFVPREVKMGLAVSQGTNRIRGSLL
jgi:hypothetical protein